MFTFTFLIVYVSLLHSFIRDRVWAGLYKGEPSVPPVSRKRLDLEASPLVLTPFAPFRIQPSVALAMIKLRHISCNHLMNNITIGSNKKLIINKQPSGERPCPRISRFEAIRVRNQIDGQGNIFAQRHIRGNHLSKTTCLRQAFLKSGE